MGCASPLHLSDMDERLLSVSEVADKYHIEPHNVLYAIRSNKLKAARVGWSWIIRESDLPSRWYSEGRKKRERKHNQKRGVGGE